jgi:CBS domain-containing protein
MLLVAIPARKAQIKPNDYYYPVVSDNRPVGIVKCRDILRA